YSVQLASALGDGTYALRARAVDAAGNVGAAGPAFSLTIDTAAPSAPAAPALAAADDSGVVGDGVTNVARPHRVGTAEGGATVQVLDASGTVLGTATAASGGAYSVQLASALADGTYAVRARAVDAAGNVGAAGPALSLTIDTTAPAAPAAPA